MALVKLIKGDQFHDDWTGSNWGANGVINTINEKFLSKGSLQKALINGTLEIVEEKIVKQKIEVKEVSIKKIKPIKSKTPRKDNKGFFDKFKRVVS